MQTSEKQRAVYHDGLYPFLAAVGVFLSLLGVYFEFLLEKRSFELSWPDREFFFLQNASLPMLVLGFLIAVVGSLLGAWRLTSAPVLLSISVIALLTASLAMKMFPINIHGWTASLILPCLGAYLIAGIFMAFAVARLKSRS
jgi:hypothetical protein